MAAFSAICMVYFVLKDLFFGGLDLYICMNGVLLVRD